jgi:hypothetical protein
MDVYPFLKHETFMLKTQFRRDLYMTFGIAHCESSGMYKFLQGTALFLVASLSESFIPFAHPSAGFPREVQWKSEGL